MLRILLAMSLLFCSSILGQAGEGKPLTPTAARKKVGAKITVEIRVQTAKDRLEKRGEIYLDAQLDFRDEKNFAVIITKMGAASLPHVKESAAVFLSPTQPLSLAWLSASCERGRSCSKRRTEPLPIRDWPASCCARRCA